MCAAKGCGREQINSNQSILVWGSRQRMRCNFIPVYGTGVLYLMRYIISELYNELADMK